MTTQSWQLYHAIDAVVFDCDATLSRIEGIDVLAKANGVAEQVRLLTEQAMAETGLSGDIYNQRLALVKPTAQQLATLGDEYYAHLTPDVDRVIQALQQLHKVVYVISAGIQRAVEDFAEHLNIPKENVFAVDVYFDNAGHYSGYETQSPMTRQRGKREVVEKLKQQHPCILHIGDGMNDVEAATVVERFIGYGGAYFRKNIAALCDFYITSQSITPLLPLTLTMEEANNLNAAGKKAYEQGLYHIENGEVLIKLQ